MNQAIAAKNTALAGLSVIVTFIANALGGWDTALPLLVGMMAVDYITGILVAAFWQSSKKSDSGALDSKAGFRGLCKKGLILLVVWVAMLLDDAKGVH